MRRLRYSINVTLDGCCDHRAIVADEELQRRATANLARADDLLFGRMVYEMMEAAWRVPAGTVRPHYRAEKIDPVHRTFWGASGNHGEDHGIGW